MSKGIGLLLFVCGTILIVLSLFPAGETPFFSLAEKGIIPEQTAKLFSDSDALGFLFSGILLWTVLFALYGATIKITFVALVIFAIGAYLLTGLVAFGAINSEKTLFWITFSFVAIPSLPVLLLIPAVLLGGSSSGGRKSRDSSESASGSGRKTIEHYDKWEKRTGESRMKGDKIEHYDDWGNKTGESKVQGNKIKHHDDWGNDVGESRIKGKTIELYDSRGNLIGGSKIRGNAVEHRDENGDDKGRSKIK